MMPTSNMIDWFQNRRTRRALAKAEGRMKYGWQNVKNEYLPKNKPMDLGINKFKKTAGVSHKDVVQYKNKVRETLKEVITKQGV